MNTVTLLASLVKTIFVRRNFFQAISNKLIYKLRCQQLWLRKGAALSLTASLLLQIFAPAISYANYQRTPLQEFEVNLFAPPSAATNLSPSPLLWFNKITDNLGFYSAAEEMIKDENEADEETEKARKTVEDLAKKEVREQKVKAIKTQLGTKRNLKAGEVTQLSALPIDENGNAVDFVEPRWESSDSSILKIDENGHAQAVKAGDAKLIVRAGKIREEFAFKISESESESIKSKETKREKWNSLNRAGNLKSPGALLNQPPDRPILSEPELPVLTSSTGNLGNPLGQTEASVTFPAAALRTRERSGIGNYGFSLPVAYLPGRGIDAGMSASYNSQLWNKSCVQYNSSGTCLQNKYTFNVDGNWLAPGFQMSPGYLDAYGNASSPPAFFVLTGADGTRHQLDLISSSYGFYFYESSDGAFVKASFQYCGGCTNKLQNLGVGFSDGTGILYGAPNSQNRRFPIKNRDRNGNFIDIAYLADDQVGKLAYIKDTLGRYISFHYEDTSEQKLVAVSVPGYNDSITPRQTIRFYYEDKPLQWTNRFDGTITAPNSIRTLKYVYFPGTNAGYRYDYSNYFGIIYKITQLRNMQVTSDSPAQTGSVIEGSYQEAAWTRYNYGGTDIQPPPPTLTDVPKYNKRIDDWAGRTAPNAAETTFSAAEQLDANGVGTRTSEITAPDSTRTVTVSQVKPNQWDDGLIKETFVTTPGRSLPWTKSIYKWDDGPITRGRRNPRIEKLEVANDVGQTRATTFQYDSYNNQTVVKEHDFAASGSLGTELRRTETAYITNAAWTNNNLLHLPQSVKTIVGATVVSRTDYEYDGLEL